MGRACTLDVLALKEVLAAGTLSERDRGIAERLLPGSCERLMR